MRKVGEIVLSMAENLLKWKGILLCLMMLGSLEGGLGPLYTEDCGGWNHDGGRVNILGPILEEGYKENESWGVIRPFAGRYINHCRGEEENYFLPPLFKATRSQNISNWNIMNLLRGRKEYSHCGELLSSRVVVFPFYMSDYNGKTGKCRQSIFPVMGGVKNIFGQEGVHWAFFPLYLGIHNNDVVTHHTPWPIIRWQTGPCAGGFGIWPLFGRKYVKGKYDKRFYLWPLIHHERICLGDGEEEVRHGFLPFYEYRCSPKKEVKRVVWPFFAHIKENEPCYEETQYLWPLLVQGRGEERYVNRWAPLYSRSIRRGVDRRWMLWPLINIKQWEDKGLSIKQERFLYFLYWKQTQRSCVNPELPEAKKISVWPLFTYWDNGAGQKQLQMLSPLEVFFPANDGVRRMYSPLFGVFRASVDCGVSKQSILWDLISAEKSEDGQKFSIGPILDIESSADGDGKFEILKGLLGYRKECGKGKFRFLWISFG